MTDYDKLMDDCLPCPKCGDLDILGISNGDKPKTMFDVECQCCGYIWNIEKIVDNNHFSVTI